MNTSIKRFFNSLISLFSSTINNTNAMSKLQNIIIILTFSTFCSCNNSSINKTLESQNDFFENHLPDISIQPDNNSSLFVDDELPIDSFLTFNFKEFSIYINGFNTYEENSYIEQISADTIEIYSEPGESIEGQLISISTEHLIKLEIEQRYETSVTIMNEGPHCDLNQWKHFYSEWKSLKQNNLRQFICEKYSKEDNEKFLDISIDELKEEVKENCGDEWYKLVEKIKMPNEYPSGVGISHYYIRIKGKRIDDGKTVTKLIVIETPMGC